MGMHISRVVRLFQLPSYNLEKGYMTCVSLEWWGLLVCVVGALDKYHKILSMSMEIGSSFISENDIETQDKDLLSRTQ